MKKKLTAAELVAEYERRSAIIREHNLRKEIAQDAAIQRDEPERWRRMEAARRARNRERAEVNRMLVAAGSIPRLEIFR